MQDFNVWMFKAGYNEEYRLRVTDKVLKKFRQQMTDEKDGVRRIHRSKEEILADRKTRKLTRTKSGWFRARGFRATLRVENSPRWGPCQENKGENQERSRFSKYEDSDTRKEWE